jgi:hypothetical protein
VPFSKLPKLQDGLCGDGVQATMPETGTIAGATLMPMVMKAQNTAAKTEAIWVREDCVMLIFLSKCRTIPAMQTI